MTTIDMTSESVPESMATVPAEGTIFMLNLLRFREQADYGDGGDPAPCSGQDAYFGRYVPAFALVAAAEGVAGIAPVWVGEVLAHPIAPPEERWDAVAIVAYPDRATFLRVVENPRYRTEAAPHRTAALRDARLIAITKVS